jgi:hypothetical protein
MMRAFFFVTKFFRGTVNQFTARGASTRMITPTLQERALEARALSYEAQEGEMRFQDLSNSLD